jgi:hypothetical protein
MQFAALGIAEVIVGRRRASLGAACAGLINQLRSTLERVPIRAPSQSANVHAPGGHLWSRWFRVI